MRHAIVGLLLLATPALAETAAVLPSVRDVGAIGDGRANDSAAVNAAQRAGAGYVLPPGSYYLDSTMIRTGIPVFAIGPVTLPHWGLPGTSNQGFWNGASGFYFAQLHTAMTGQATVVINSVNRQPAGTRGESGALYVSTVDEADGANSAGIAIIAQASAVSGNHNANMSTINAYASWDANTQGSGSVMEADVHNSTGTDDPWPLDNRRAKSGPFIVSDGTNRPSYALGITASGAPFQAGSVYFDHATAQYDLIGLGAIAARWSIDSRGNLAGQSLTLAVPVTVTSASTAITLAQSSVIFKTAATCVVTLPSAASAPGRIYHLKNIAPHAIVSAAADVVPLDSALPGRAIMPQAAGKFVMLQSDGQFWQVMQAN